jgi:hypothetical protein
MCLCVRANSQEVTHFKLFLVIHTDSAPKYLGFTMCVLFLESQSQLFSVGIHQETFVS